MSTLETRKIEPLSGTTVTLGASGDAVTMPAGVTVKTNTVKDAGGNTIWTSDGSGTLSSVNSSLQAGMTLILKSCCPSWTYQFTMLDILSQSHKCIKGKRVWTCIRLPSKRRFQSAFGISGRSPDAPQATSSPLATL